MPCPRPCHNLPPRDYARFVGRHTELAALRRLLQPYPASRHHLLVVDGIGGIGKSALALETAYALCDAYGTLPEAERFDAVVWVSAKQRSLTAEGIREQWPTFRTLDHVYAAIAQVLDYPAITRAPTDEQRPIVEQVLRQQRTLLILDNLETVDDEALLAFLRELPDPTKAIVTTRHRVDVAYPLRLTGMPHADALALIAQEAARKQVSLPVETQEELWRRTGGVPLAIVWSIGLMGLGGSIEHVLRRLGSGQSDIARFCFAESVAEIRGRDAHRLLLALSLFATDASREALGVVAGLGDDEYGRDTGLEKLLRLSLVNKEGERFSMLPLTRSFVQREPSPTAEWLMAAQQRWQEYFFELVEVSGGWTINWQGHDRVERELPNILAVVETLVGALRLGEAPCETQPLTPAFENLARQMITFILKIARVCRLRGYWSECERLSYTVIQVCQLIHDTGELGWRYYDLSRISHVRGNIADAEAWIRKAHAVWGAEWPALSCFADRLLGLLVLEQGQLDEAEQLLTRALHAYDATHTPGDYSLPTFYEAMGLLAEAKGELAGALGMYRQSVDLCLQNGNTVALSASLLSLGKAILQSGDARGARQHYGEALQIARECRRADAIARAIAALAALDYQQGDYPVAAANARQAIDLFRRLGMKRQQAAAEVLLARIVGEAASG